MNWFISQPMSGRTDEEIQAERDKVTEAIFREDENAVVIDSYIKGITDVEKPIWALGEAVKKLADADICAFVRDCLSHSRGCRIECLVCAEYGIQIVEYDTDEDKIVYP